MWNATNVNVNKRRVRSPFFFSTSLPWPGRLRPHGLFTQVKARSFPFPFCAIFQTPLGYLNFRLHCNDTMDCGRLPSYRSSYLLRFHPYARVKPSARERVMAVQYTDDGSLLSDEERLITSSQSAVWDSLQVPADAIAQNLNDAINDTTAVDEPLRRLSISTLVVELALLMGRKASSTVTQCTKG